MSYKLIKCQWTFQAAELGARLTLRPCVRDLSPLEWVASQEAVLTSLPRASLAAWPPLPPPVLQRQRNCQRVSASVKASELDRCTAARTSTKHTSWGRRTERRDQPDQQWADQHLPCRQKKRIVSRELLALPPTPPAVHMGSTRTCSHGSILTAGSGS